MKHALLLQIFAAVAGVVFASLAAFGVLVAVKDELALYGVQIGLGLLALAAGGFLYMERGSNQRDDHRG